MSEEDDTYVAEIFGGLTVTDSEPPPPDPPLDKFDLFPNLPAELQLDIWDAAVQDIPGVVLRAEDFSPYCHGDYQIRTHVHPDTHVRAITRRWWPGLLRFPDAVKAARKAGFVHDDVAFPGHTVWFNPTKDVVYFRNSLLYNMATSAPHQSPFARAQLNSLLQKAETILVQSYSVLRCWVFLALANTDRFPNLKKLVVQKGPVAVQHAYIEVNPVSPATLANATWTLPSTPGKCSATFLHFEGFPAAGTIERIRTIEGVRFPHFAGTWKLNGERILDPDDDEDTQWTLGTRDYALEERWMFTRKCYFLASIGAYDLADLLGDVMRRQAVFYANDPANSWYSDDWVIEDLNNGYNLVVEELE